MHIAFADEQGRVSLWCDHMGTDEQGHLLFTVINGGWQGKFKDNMIYVNKTKESLPAFLVWSGRCDYDDVQYNEAIAWIQSEIDQ